jgi:hypothetical protein
VPEEQLLSVSEPQVRMTPELANKIVRHLNAAKAMIGANRYREAVDEARNAYTELLSFDIALHDPFSVNLGGLAKHLGTTESE